MVAQTTALSTRQPWYRRWATGLSTVTRAAMERLPSLRSAPPSLFGSGLFSSFRVTRPGSAQDELEALAVSPTVYAAVMLRAYTLASYPIVVLRTVGGKDTPVNPESQTWAGSLVRLLQTPDPEDVGAIAPQMSGEQLVAQLVADVLLPGGAYVAPTMDADGHMIGLTRLHPQSVSLEVRHGVEEWRYQTSRGQVRWYPRRAVFHIPSLSWQSDARGVFGVGAATPLAHLINAESTALEQTATMIEQGGADVIITGKTPAMMSWLKDPANRKAIEADLTNALKGKNGRRFTIIGGDLEMGDSGLKPADLKAPELLAAARESELAALGTVPVALGSDEGTFATAALQMRMQYHHDEILAARLEAGFFRPLAQFFARQAGGHTALRAHQFTARLDLSQHPGQAYIRTDAVDRMTKTTAMGWTAEQAAGIERMEWPKPEGAPKPAPGATPAAANSEPTPVGNGAASGSGDATPAEPRTLGHLFTRATDPAATPDPSAAWRAIAARRAPGERALHAAADRVLATEREAYAAAIVHELTAAGRAVDGLATRQDATGPGLYTYGPINLDAILGDAEEAAARWDAGLRGEWTSSWASGMRHALDGTGFETEAPHPTITAEDYAWLEESAAACADYSRERVTAIVATGRDQGLSPSATADLLSADQGFSRQRGLLVARTESVRSDSIGTLSRYSAAEASGLDIEQKWLSDPIAAMFDRHHELLDGVTKKPGESWTFLSGKTATGPGLSGDPGEDCNCRCGVAPKVTRRPVV